jgi:hypothetical protein
MGNLGFQVQAQSAVGRIAAIVVQLEMDFVT